jgi:serine phosphatase RsbU (regulator of sigma subunit)
VAQKQKLIIEAQKDEVDDAYRQLHEKNKQVMDSINYARRIQNSLLPTEKFISRILDKKIK